MTPWILLAVGASAALFALHGLFPLRRPWPAIGPAWIAGWFAAELPIHLLLGLTASVAGLVALGGLEAWPGQLGAGLAGVAALASIALIGRARRTAAIVDAALERDLGVELTELTEPTDRAESLGGPPTGAARLARMAAVLPFGRRDVVREREIPFHRDETGRVLTLDVRRAASRPTGRPVLLYVHGGGWVIGDKTKQGLVTVNQMAAAGWTCVSTSYGLAPRATWPDLIIDVKRAIRWVRDHVVEHGGDPARIVLVGGSAGAHLAALAALTPNDPALQPGFEHVDTSVAGCIGYYGVYDWTDRHGHWPHGALPILLERIVVKRRRAEHPELFEAASPIARIGPDAPPFLLIHGDRDVLAPVDESRRFAEALRAAGAPVGHLELPGAQHAFELVPTTRSLAVLDSVERFATWAAARRAAAATRRSDRLPVLTGV